MRKRPIIAICYDFDGTLSPRNMQEYDYIPQLGIKQKVFWDLVKKRAKEQDADEILCYMNLMIEKANIENNVRLSRADFKKYGKGVDLFEGVEQWFKRINKYATSRGAKVEHYIISSGIKEMIEGTKIRKWFKRIYASSFIYDQNRIARWPGLAVNYTTKTQFLFRINKGSLDIWDNTKINRYTPEEKRYIPFERMIYIGDGSTDVPCMRLVKEQGGYAVAVFRPHSRKSPSPGLLKDGRVNFVSPADYRPRKRLDVQIKKVIDKITAEYKLEN